MGSESACAEVVADTIQELTEEAATPLLETFHRDVLGSITSPSAEIRVLSSLFSNTPTAIRPDGHIATAEESVLFLNALDYYLQQTPDDQDQAIYDLVQHLQANDLPKQTEIPIQTLKPITNACDRARCNEATQILFDYLAQEVRMAEAKNTTAIRYNSSNIEYIDGLLDRCNDPNFIQFANSREHLPKGVIQDIRTTVVDWIASAPDAPVIFIWLDQHNILAHQRMLLIDWAALRPYNPFYGVEAVKKGTVEESNGLTRDFNTVISAHNQAQQVSIALTAQAQAAGLVQNFSKDQYPAAFAAFATVDDKASRVIDLEKQLLAACRNPNPKIRLKTDTIIQSFYQDYPDFFKSPYLAQINDCVYNGALHLVGYEDEINVKLQIPGTLLGKMIFSNDTLQFVTLAIHRSQRAIDNMLELMDDADKTFAVMRMGKAHYPSLYEHALRRGDVNVVFLRLEDPAPYNGPLPQLP